MNKTIALCASVSFYHDVVTAKNQLQTLGYRVIMPELAELMEQHNDYRFESYKDSFYKGDFYGRKAEAIRTHFHKIEASDAVLIINNQKHGVEGYIGPNVLMEMALAFHFNKPIFLLNPFPKDSPFADELTAIKPIIVNNKLENITLPATD